MGWFDDSDSDEEDKNNKQQQTQQLASNNGYNNDEEEEDPLDAYMKTLNNNAATTTTKKPGRLDIDNEEEATGHWVERSNNNNNKDSDEFNNTPDNDERNNNSSNNAASIAARQALDNAFCKAGEATKKNQSNNNTRAYQQGDEEEDLLDKTSPSKTNNNNGGNVDIELERVNHHTMNYESFEKNFWKPSDTSDGHSWRKEHDVTCIPGTIDPIFHFAELRDVFGQELIDWINQKGYSQPTLVQSQTLPAALSGNDTIITASTGSGKTLAYIWPLVVHVCDQPHLTKEETGPIGLVLVPTRELANQVQSYAKIMLKPFGGKSITVTGGMGGYQLVKEIKSGGGGGVEIVVATPGRLLDVLSKETSSSGAKNYKKKNNYHTGLSLRRVTMVVLDEADRMLHMGFASQVTQILQNIRPDRQTLMLSATMSHKIEKVAQQWLNLNSQVRISVGRTGESSQNVQQHVLVLPNNAAKTQFLLEMLPTFSNVGRTLVFVATRDGCEELYQQIHLKHSSSSLTIATLHGDKHQSDRNLALRQFSKGTVSILIATDVAARGLDIPSVVTVINYDPAKNLDAHVHRIGRAGRLSKNGSGSEQPGTAYTLLNNHKKDADFAQILCHAFEREGREISSALRQLANTSRKAGNVVSSRSKWNKAGLGSDQRDLSSTTSSTSYYGPAAVATNSNATLPPPTTASNNNANAAYARQPPAKKSRWS